ncbi:zinc finger protein 260-like isoform X1 [Micropterus salmoides]|uniref:zinc finger protein 260-like isoform X1 n=2 Tax=Micropterus salmoides TaxID=27706 RepID=UPI0018ED590E|nr:zinc finger protein 260-like isoform X1 [Micropterus salmoides]
MADFSSSILMFSEHPAVGAGPAGRATSSSGVSGNAGWDGSGGMDQITVVRIDDTHIAEEQSHVGVKVKDAAAEYYEMEYSIPAEEEVAAAAAAAGEEEEDGVYVIEYSNPEEEGESYQFTMSVDRSLPAKKPVTKNLVVGEDARAPSPVTSKPLRPARPRQEARQKKKLEAKKEEVLSNKCVLELGENYSDVMEMNSGKRLVCSLCPPPGRFFKRGSGLAVHLKQMHQLMGKKTFFCASCKQTVRSQIELDAHTRRHANQDAVFTCLLCSAEAENKTDADKAVFKGSRWGLKRHLETEHPGVIPRCDICNKGFKTLVSYLADQFRHVGVSPYHCAKCQIYEMTERGLTIHIKNHDKKSSSSSSSSSSSRGLLKTTCRRLQSPPALITPPPTTLTSDTFRLSKIIFRLKQLGDLLSVRWTSDIYASLTKLN